MHRGTNERKTHQCRINVLGFLTHASGIGESARGYARALERLDHLVSHGDTTPREFRTVDAGRYQNTRLHSNNHCNIIIANPFADGLFNIERHVGLETLRKGYNVGCWWWELAGKTPSAWRKGAELYDEIWAGSRFNQEIFRENFDMPVKLVPPIVRLHIDRSLTRRKFGLEDDEKIFLFVCDFKSNAERKNPLAVIKAFRKAFSPSEKARLVIKYQNEDFNSKYAEQMKRAAADARVEFLSGTMTKVEVDSLINLSDCYVSLHRSEGFGLTIAEAMLAGKPVIACGYSGPEDFLTERNSFIVPYKLRELERDERPYLRGNVWAEADTDAAAEFMRFVFDSPERAAEFGEQAKLDIERDYSPQSVANAIEDAIPTRALLEQVEGRFAQRHRAVTAIFGERPAAIPMMHPLIRGGSPEVSICMPVFNGQDFLSEAIESVLGQTKGNFELLISDDGSVDESKDIIRQYAEKDSRIKHWTNEQRLGLFGNYNECFRRASGEYIKPFSQDDVLRDDYIEVATSTMRSHPQLALFASRRSFIGEMNDEINADNFNNIAPIIRFDLPVRGIEARAQCLFPVVNRIGEPVTVMFPRKFLNSGFNSAYYQLGDLDFWFRILTCGDFFHSSEELCKFRMHPHSASAANLRSLVFAIDILRLGKEHRETLDAINRTWDDFLYWAMSDIGTAVSSLSEGDLFFGAHYAENELRASDASLLRELVFYTLRHGRSAGPAETMSTFALRIRDLEDEIRALLASKSWVTTKPLRELNKVLTADSSEDFELESDEYDERAYFSYLTDLKSKILNSRSWAISKPFREFSRS